MKKYLVFLFCIIALLLPNVVKSRQGGSALQTLAASLSTRQWGSLNTIGRTISGNTSTGPDSGFDIQDTFNLSNPHMYAADGILPFDTKLAYDQVNQIVYVYGGVHGNGGTFPGWYCPGETHQGDPNATLICAQYFQYFEKYDIASNQWSIILDSVNGHHNDNLSSRHGDSVLSIDSITGDIYYAEKLSGVDGIFKFPFSTKTWSLLSPGNSGTIASSTLYSMSWFPEANGLIAINQPSGSIAFFDKSLNSWSTILTGFPINDYPIALYNPINHNMLVWGGAQGFDGSGTPVGGRQFWIITRESGTWKYVLPNGTTTTNQASAVRTFPLINLTACGSGNFAAMWDATGARGSLQVDPNNGHYELLTKDATCTTVLDDYDPAADSWTTPVSTTIPVPIVNNFSFGAGSETPGVALPDHNVIFYLNAEASNQGFNVYLYKGAGTGGGGDTTPPSVPMALHKTAQSGTSIEMMWTASTDDTAVTGYNILRSTNGGSSFSQIAQVNYPIYNNIGLTVNTNYIYKVNAFDANNNVSANSTTINVTTDTLTYDYAGKCGLSGVVKCRAFDNPNELVYGWPSVVTNSTSDAFAGTICDTAMAIQVPGAPNRRNSFVGAVPYPTPFANTRATVQNGNCVFPVVDNSMFHSGGGSLKMTIPNHSTQDTSGEFSEPFKIFSSTQFGYIGPNVGANDFYGTSVVNLGTDLWIQWYQRFETGMIWPGSGNNTGHFDSYYFSDGFVWTTPGAGSLTNTNTDCVSHPIPAGAISRNLWYAFIASNFTSYTPFSISSVAGDGCSLQTTTSASPSGAGGVPNAGFGFISNPFPANPGSRTDGFKQFGVFGNPSLGGNGTCCAPATQLSTNGDLLSIPREYSYDPGTFYYGGQDNRNCLFTDYDTVHYTEPPCVRFKTNQWMEFTVHIHQVGRNCEHNSTFEKWVDAQKVADLTTFALCNGMLAGLGQYNLNPYQTLKDPNQAYTDTHSWWDDIIISTQPIPMGSTVSVTPPVSHKKLYFWRHVIH